MISKTPKPPYYAVIFTSIHALDDNGYESMAQKMDELVQKQAGFLGFESARDATGLGITVSYWETLESISMWKKNTEHREAQILGKEKWYQNFKVRICKVERDY
jgi:heme-degrading monooxygenase HmoA